MPPLDMERASSLCLSPSPGKMAGIFGDGACGLALRALAVPLLRAEGVVAVDGANRFDPSAGEGPGGGRGSSDARVSAGAPLRRPPACRRPSGCQRSR